MKPLRFFTLTLLFVTGIGIPSCFVCDCLPVEGNYYRAEKAYLINYRRLPNGLVEDLDAFDSVAIGSYQVAMGFEYTFYGSLSPRRSAPFSFINNAYACNCPEGGKLGSKEKIQSLDLLTVNNFNKHFQAGDTINDLVEVIVNSDTLPLSEFSRRELQLESYFLRLKEKPEAGEAFQLKLLLVLDNGDTIETTSESVILE